MFFYYFLCYSCDMKKKMTTIFKLVLIIFLMVLAWCSRTRTQSSAQRPYKISAEQAYNMMSESDNYILLDVRTNEEYQERHIKGAVLIPDFELADRAEKELPDKNSVILVYCRSGRRSGNAANLLTRLGYTNVYDFGGIVNWPY